MSHSFKASKGTNFHYNGDFSGSVNIVRDGLALGIPAEDLLEFVAECYVAPRLISKIEDASTDELFGGSHD